MGSKKQVAKQWDKGSKAKLATALALFGVMLITVIAFAAIGGTNEEGPSSSIAGNGDLVIQTSVITEKAQFYPYSVGELDMEVIAVKASDGSIRTAFNTCQVCFDSGRGYYRLEENMLVCQNCGNRFSPDQVEIVTGGCNPVPILSENKTEDKATITIPKDYLEENQDLFSNWSKT